jgi:hypothetical protein
MITSFSILFTHSISVTEFLFMEYLMGWLSNLLAEMNANMYVLFYTVSHRINF